MIFSLPRINQSFVFIGGDYFQRTCPVVSHPGALSSVIDRQQWKVHRLCLWNQSYIFLTDEDVLNGSEAAKADPPPPVKYVNPQIWKLLSLKVNVVSVYLLFFSRCSTYGFSRIFAMHSQLKEMECYVLLPSGYKMVDVSLTKKNYILPFLTFINSKVLFVTCLLSSDMIFLRPNNVHSRSNHYSFLAYQRIKRCFKRAPLKTACPVPKDCPVFSHHRNAW